MQIGYFGVYFLIGALFVLSTMRNEEKNKKFKNEVNKIQDNYEYQNEGSFPIYTALLFVIFLAILAWPIGAVYKLSVWIIGKQDESE